MTPTYYISSIDVYRHIHALYLPILDTGANTVVHYYYYYHHRASLFKQLIELSSQTTEKILPLMVPPNIIEYVARSRNPDIYAREFYELAMRSNQVLKGKAETYMSFAEKLARDTSAAFPELAEAVKAVMTAKIDTGGAVGGDGSGRDGGTKAEEGPSRQQAQPYTNGTSTAPAGPNGSVADSTALKE